MSKDNGTNYEAVAEKGNDSKVGAARVSFNPYAERKNEHSVTDFETFTHLLKAGLGSGILTMPLAFSYCGLVFGIFVTVIISAIGTHCDYILITCAHTLYHRHHITQMGYSEIAIVALREGPEWGRKFSYISRYVVEISLFITYFGVSAVYLLIVVINIKQVVEYYVGEGVEYNIRICLLVILVPVILLTWVPNLKYLTPFSMVANILMAIGLGIIIYYLVTDLPPIGDRKLYTSFLTIPPAIAIVLFSIGLIGIVMPLENQMKNPTDLVGIFGILNIAMGCVTIFYIVLGFLGYWRYGDGVLGAISFNLPKDDYLAQAVKILVALSVFFTFGIQFYVCIDIGWTLIRDKFTKQPTITNYVMRTFLATLCVLLAIAVPTVGAFVGLIGALFTSSLALLMPVLLETIVYWDEGFGRFYWMVWKNIIVFIVGIIALIFGSIAAITEIARMEQLI